jgi:hypothetical protein
MPGALRVAPSPARMARYSASEATGQYRREGDDLTRGPRHRDGERLKVRSDVSLPGGGLCGPPGLLCTFYCRRRDACHCVNPNCSSLPSMKATVQPTSKSTVCATSTRSLQNVAGGRPRPPCVKRWASLREPTPQVSRKRADSTAGDGCRSSDFGRLRQKSGSQDSQFPSETQCAFDVRQQRDR